MPARPRPIKLPRPVPEEIGASPLTHTHEHDGHTHPELENALAPILERLEALERAPGPPVVPPGRDKK